MITEQEREAILRAIWRGNITINNPPVVVYNDNRTELTGGVEEGYGATLSGTKKGTKQFTALSSLTDNVTFFSAAKTYQQTNDMSFVRFDEDGFLKTFSQFKKDAGTIFDTYNQNWLASEFQTAVAQSQGASKWVDIQDKKEVLPLLQYQTVGDERVREEHAGWDGITRPVDDSFWDSRYPPNGYVCRCTVIQISEGRVSSLANVKGNSERLFSDNVGKSEIVFKETGDAQHPYFKVPPKDEKLKSNHFNLPK